MNKQYWILLPLILLLLFPLQSIQAQDVVRYNISTEYPDPKQKYYIDVLEMVLEHSRAEFGDYQLNPVIMDVSQGRTSIMVEQESTVDVTWRMTSKDLEERLQAIFFPVLKGMMGYRIFIIRHDDSFFTPSTTLAQIKSIPAGQGHDWPDSEILRFNGFDVIEGGAYNLLDMLDKNRFDYFPRALHEPWTEIENNSKFIVDRFFLLKYHAPMYFFVNKKNSRLYDRISKGFQKSIASGAFDALFYQHPITQGILSKANVSQRKVFELKNPLLSDKSKALIKDKELWLDLEFE